MTSLANISVEPGWLTLVPPLLAIGLAIWWKNVIAALFVGIFAGGVILADGNPWAGFLLITDKFIHGGLADADHVYVILFTLFLGAMVGVMTRGGASHALVGSMARFTSKREHAQMLTSGVGVVVFFDDYANTLMLGGTMRPVTDRLRISREKLAFLVDSTAAPVAGLFLISTWIGTELKGIEDGLGTREVGDASAYTLFLWSIPYRFYPWLVLGFLWMIAATGRDFGPMLKAERRALETGEVSKPGSKVAPAETEESFPEKSKWSRFSCALVPLLVLVIAIAIGLAWTGIDSIEGKNAAIELANKSLPAEEHAPLIEHSLQNILSNSDSYGVLLISALLASLTAVLMAVSLRTMKLNEATDAWQDGIRDMIPAMIVLLLAWAMAGVCGKDSLNTGAYLGEAMRGNLQAELIPGIAFLLAAGMAFATGSSWATMGILLPIAISTTFHVLEPASAAQAVEHDIMIAAIGAVLAGAILGDHCSPISDTTVLSSAACGCDHLDHVSTQMPYAITVGAVALFCGYVPAGYGVSPWISLPVALAVLFVIVRLVGKRVELKGTN